MIRVALFLLLVVCVRAAEAQPAAPAVAGPLPVVETWDPVLAAALAVLEAEPTAANHRQVASAYLSFGVTDIAHRHLSAAIALDPSDAVAYEARARIWRDWGFARLGIGDAHRAVYYAPQSAEAENTLGTLLQALGEPADARHAYERALTLDNRAAYVASNLCYLLLAQGEMAGAEAACRRAVAADPASTTAHNNLGLVYATAGRMDDAEAAFLEGGGQAWASFNLGLVYLATGDVARARDRFAEALRHDPRLDASRVRLRQALALLRDRATMSPVSAGPADARD